MYSEYIFLKALERKIKVGIVFAGRPTNHITIYYVRTVKCRGQVESWKIRLGAEVRVVEVPLCLKTLRDPQFGNLWRGRIALYNNIIRLDAYNSYTSAVVRVCVRLYECV